jgi:ribose transport system permease protein
MIAHWLRRYGTLVAFAALVAAFSIAAPQAFPTKANLLNLVQQMTTLAVVAVAATFVMIIGEFDLSVGFVASLAAVIAFVLFPLGVPVWAAILAGLAAGVAAGVANGFLVARFNVPSFVATLAVGTIVSGFAYWASGGSSLFSGVPAAFTTLGRADFLGVPLLAIWMAVVVGVAAIVLRRTRYGRHIHAIGDNAQAARLSGLPVARDRIIAFTIAGGLAALAGLLLAARLGSVQHTMGEVFLLPAYAAVFLGTTVSQTGTPTIGGTLLGVALAGVIANGLTILGAATFVQSMVTGAIIIAAVLFRQAGSQR